MKITLNLATKPYADQGPALKRLRIGIAVLAGVLILLGLGLMHFHQRAKDMRALEATADQQIIAVQQEEQGYRLQMQQPANARVLTQAEFLNSLFDEKSFSWTAAMEDLERVLPGGVQVTALEPVRAKDGRLTLRLRVSGQRERAVELVRKMEHSPRFAAPRISGENSEAANSQNGMQQASEDGKVTFEMLAEYNPATLEERKAEIAAEKRVHPGAVTAASPAAAMAQRPHYVAPNQQPIRNRQNMPGGQNLPAGQYPAGAMPPRTGAPPYLRPGQIPGQVPPSGGPQ
jgi:type IV pilus assembly protein PilN